MVSPRIGPVAGSAVNTTVTPCPDCPPPAPPQDIMPGGSFGGSSSGPPPPFTNCPGANGSGFYPARLGLAFGGSYCGSGNIFSYGAASPCNGWVLFSSYDNFTAGAFPTTGFYDRGDVRVGNHITFSLVGRGILTFWCASGQSGASLNLAINSGFIASSIPQFGSSSPTYFTIDLTQECTHDILITPSGGTGGDVSFYFAGISWALI